MKQRQCSVREFALGCIEHHRQVSITREHGAYIVKGFSPTGKYVAKGFRTIGAARKFAAATNRR